MVLNALGINARSGFIDSERSKKGKHGFVALAGFARESVAFRGQSKRLMGLRVDESFASKAAHHAADRDMRQAKALSDASNPSFNACIKQFCDCFTVILRRFRFVLLA
jgi:hypothetical protein